MTEVPELLEYKCTSCSWGPCGLIKKAKTGYPNKCLYQMSNAKPNWELIHGNKIEGSVVIEVKGKESEVELDYTDEY